MPSRWLIDGMNLIGARPDRWWNDPDRAMREMAERLDGYARSTGDEVTVVFDKDPGGLPALERTEVVIASWKGRNAADHEIVETVAADAAPSELWVVTSDKKLADKVRSLGARVAGSGSFRKRLDATDDG
ncbi:MAG: NYN domain-containing protein [Actinomycetota bacterium]